MISIDGSKIEIDVSDVHKFDTNVEKIKLIYVNGITQKICIVIIT